MDKNSTFLFDGKEVIGLEKLINHVSGNVNRELNELERSIVTFLYNDFVDRMNNRFCTDENKDVLAFETGDKAGIIELTDDYACAFKAKPVYASTPGKITGPFCAANEKAHREIFTHGAQPLASLVSLSTNTPVNTSAQIDLNNAVKDAGSFHNTYGIPMIGGDIQFHYSVRQKVAANFLTVGLIDKDAMLSNACYGEDNIVYTVNSRNEELPQSRAFQLRTMYEFICDLHEERLVTAIQNVGKNGILGACSDMVAAGINGIRLEADSFIPDTENFQGLMDCIPNHIVLIIDKTHDKKLEKICKKWNKECRRIGTVQAERRLSVLLNGELIADMPITFADFNVIAAEKEINLPDSGKENKKRIVDVPLPDNYQALARFMMTCPNLLSRQWIFEQFDSTIGTNNLSTNYISDAPVLQIKGSRHAMAVSFCHNTSNLNDHPEAVNLAIADAMREVICSGGTPRALTGCLNYSGSPEPETRMKLKNINEQVAFTCKKLGLSSSGIETNCVKQTGQPVIHDVSIGAIAFLNDKHQHMTKSFKAKGDMIYLIGRSSDDLSSSEYIRSYHDIYDSPPQYIDMDAEVKLLRVAQKIISRKLVKSAHSISKGGLFMALLHSAMVRSFGFDITVDEEIRKDAFLFGEAPSRIIVSVATAREADFIDFMIETEVPFLTLGHVTREEIRIDDNSFGFISDYKKRYLNN